MEFLAELHHKIIHFPIALLFIYPYIEAVSIFYKKEFFSFTSLVILILGIAASLAAVLTGNQALNSIDKMNPDLYELADKHYTYANIVVWLFSVILFSRIYLQIKKRYEGMWKIILLLIAFAGCYLIYQTGEYGGKTAHTRISTIFGKNE
ncbi:MAG: hypothetical protein HRF52_04920 [Ignavibacterium sp.]|uniref:DUF2231 domain-containing protein n=1 Tax=Ignavibacterium sp. TaxID=2651167 RepID=UPI0032985A5E